MLRRVTVLLAATALGAAAVTATVTAPAGAAVPCPAGQTGLFVPPGTYPVATVPGTTVGAGPAAIPLIRVVGPGGNETTIYLVVPAVSAFTGALDLALTIGSPGIGLCVLGGLPPTLYVGVPRADATVTGPGASVSGTMLVVTPDNLACVDIPLVLVDESTPPYDVYGEVRWCTFDVSLTPNPVP